MNTWIKPTPRGDSRKLRAMIFLRQDGLCGCGCGQKLHVKRWILEHVEPLADGGADDPSNMAAYTEDCAKAKTKAEAGARAKARRTRDKFTGIMPKSKSRMKFGRDSRLKKKLDGTVVDRSTGEPV